MSQFADRLMDFADATLVHLANQVSKYCYVYSEDMEIDIIPDQLFQQVGLVGPLKRLLTGRPLSPRR